MKRAQTDFYIDRLFMITALLLLVAVVGYGLLASVYYVSPGLLKEKIGFMQLRPLHVTAVVFWILMAACGVVYNSFREQKVNLNLVKWLGWGHYVLWTWGFVQITGAYLKGEFGGREYWEFPPVYAWFIAVGWILFFISFLLAYARMPHWKVYHWMWFTGIVFFIFTFLENYLWIFPFVNRDAVKDLAIQWKANGSLVGSWNQLVYGIAFYLMEKLSGNDKYVRSSIAFAMYFLGLFNLMFNWGHHIYTLPVPQYVRYISYAVSMTEWVILLRIIFLWKRTMTSYHMPVQSASLSFLKTSDKWVLANLILALLMSIPGLNLYTHGTHVTVAHAMGTTAGINTMILLGASTAMLQVPCISADRVHTTLKKLQLMLNISLAVFLSSLLLAGVLKGVWQMDAQQSSFQAMMQNLRPFFILFFIAGFGVAVALCGICLVTIRGLVLCSFKRKSGITHFNPVFK